MPNVKHDDGFDCFGIDFLYTRFPKNKRPGDDGNRIQLKGFNADSEQVSFIGLLCETII